MKMTKMDKKSTLQFFNRNCHQFYHFKVNKIKQWIYKELKKIKMQLHKVDHQFQSILIVLNQNNKVKNQKIKNNL